MVDSRLAGKCLAEIMAKRNILPKQLAERLHVTDTSVYEWRSGRRTPNIHFLVDIADILDVSLDELVGRVR